jgi:lipoprotein NlpI
MRQVYDMFREKLTPEDVLRAGGGSPDSEFYAHLYIGLYFDALGDLARAREHIEAAAAGRFAAAGGYMHTVARVHLARLQRR